jgi:hypothetical protein
MSVRELGSVWDGDQGPPIRISLKESSGAAKDLSNAAIECLIVEEDGTLVARRPGVIVSPKSGGLVDIWIKGLETDWDGAGKVLYVKPRIWLAVSPTGTAATNELLNPSFDTDANSDGVADSWVKTGTWTPTFITDGPMPAAIFGSAQGGAVSATTFILSQAVTTSIAAGDIWMGGVWYRGSVTSGSVRMRISDGGLVVAMPSGVSDWVFLRSYRVFTATAASVELKAIEAGTAASATFRVDDAFLFKGSWNVSPCDPLRLIVRGRARVAKTGGNLVAGVGGFEQDSNSDGLADGWAKTGTAVAYTREVDPDLLYSGRASQKCVLTDPTANLIWTQRRGHFKAGETWRASVRVLTSGTLSAGAGTGGFQLTLRTDDYDGAAQTASTALTNPAAAWTDHAASITLAEDRNSLLVEVWLNGKTGTMWLDDVRLTRV